MKCPNCHYENPSETKFCGNCGASLIPTDKAPPQPTKTLLTSMRDLTIGSTFAGRYRVIEELGKGGMGKVYKVLDTKIEEKVALKLLNLEFAPGDKTLDRFRNELKLARKISHRHVCRMYDLSEAEGIPYITMEYVSGEDLKSLIRRIGQFTVGKAIFIARQVCDGLTEAHRLGVVHRDLKPQNIMIDSDGNVRIMDFGIARSLRTKGITDTGEIFGTPEYMSPESLEAKAVDGRTDIYALGIILYEMLTGRVPFEGETPLTVALKQKTEIPKDPRNVNVQIPENLSHVILKCMNKEKEKRYKDTQELAAELAKIEGGMPRTEKIVPERRPVTSREITVKFSLKKLFVPALIFIAVIVIGVLAWRFLSQRRTVSFAANKPSLAVMHFENNTGDANLDHWRKALSDLLIADLSQSKYIAVLSGEELYNILEEKDLLDTKSYSSRALENVSSRAGVDYVLVGKMMMAGDTIRIDTTLQEAKTGKVVGSERVEGQGEDSFFAMVDELTRKVKASFKLTDDQIASDIDREARTITTSSPEAYKYYRDGMKFLNNGDWAQSIAVMEMAVGIDPGFAMAYRALAAAYENLGYRSESKTRLEKAFELTDRVSDRERFHIQGYFYMQSENTYDRAIAAYTQLLKLYPEDGTAINNLGSIYNVLEQWDKAVETLEEIRKNKDESVLSYWNLHEAYSSRGDMEKSREVLEDYLDNISENAIIYALFSQKFILEGKYDLALEEAEKAFALDPTHYRNFILRGDLFCFQDDLASAESEYMKLFDIKEPVAHDIGLRRLGGLYILQGRFDQAREQLNQGLDLSNMLEDSVWEAWFRLYLAYVNLRAGDLEAAMAGCEQAGRVAEDAGALDIQRRAFFMKGLVFLEMNAMDEAQATAHQLLALIDRGMIEKAKRYHHHLLGMIELKKGNLAQAIQEFTTAISLLPAEFNIDSWHAMFMDALARAYYLDGNMDAARKEYENIASLTVGRMYHGDIFARSLYMLGKICQEKGETEKAVEYYERFLEILKNTDKESPELVDAKEQLSRLGID
jgi:serine/threonine protein kinase/Flp pilus assembly protein TadD